MSEFRCWRCADCNDSDHIKYCAKTFSHQLAELKFHVEAIKKEWMSNPFRAHLTHAIDEVVFLAPVRRFIDRVFDRIWPEK